MRFWTPSNAGMLYMYMYIRVSQLCPGIIYNTAAVLLHLLGTWNCCYMNIIFVSYIFTAHDSTAAICEDKAAAYIIYTSTIACSTAAGMLTVHIAAV